MKHLKIYLAGKMNGLTHEEMSSWRKECTCKILEGLIYGGYNTEVNIIDPINYYNFKEKRHQTEIEVEEFDLAHATTSDIIIVNLEGLNSSIGTIIELHDAHYHHKVPVIAFGDKRLYEQLHPWVKNDITRVEDNMDKAITYIKDFYF